MAGKTLLRASRPNFLVLTPLCAGLGIALAGHPVEALGWLNVVLVMAGALLAHTAVNLLNEYQDFRSGLDLITVRTPFSGGSGALPDNPHMAPLVLAAAVTSMILVAIIGLHFLWLRGSVMLLPGVVGLALVMGYTRWITRMPVLCLLAPGLGFGPIIVLGTLLALGGHPDSGDVLISLVVMFLVSELLLINQIPDTDADRQAGRRHLPIVLGLNACARIVGGLLLGAYLLLTAGLLSRAIPPSGALALSTLPAALWVARTLPATLNDVSALPRVLGVNVATLLATLVLLCVGLW